VALAQNNGKVQIFIDRWGMLSETNGGGAAAMSFPLYPTGKTGTDISAIRLCVASGGRIEQKKQGAAC
jgi:type IV fimbrial biogenesis protein FimT